MNMTDKEKELLTEIIFYYEPEDEEGYMESLNASQKGVLASLIKKDLVIDCSDYDDPQHNYKPTPEGLQAQLMYL